MFLCSTKTGLFLFFKLNLFKVDCKLNIIDLYLYKLEIKFNSETNIPFNYIFLKFLFIIIATNRCSIILIMGTQLYIS